MDEPRHCPRWPLAATSKLILNVATPYTPKVLAGSRWSPAQGACGERYPDVAWRQESGGEG